MNWRAMRWRRSPRFKFRKHRRLPQTTRTTWEDLLTTWEDLLTLMLTGRDVITPFMPYALPKRGRTVMKLPVKTPSPIIVAPGQYIHIGVENALKYVPVSVTGLEKIVLDINLDGVCMAESPPVTSWPIMLSIVGSNVRPFPCGVYIGPGQPGNANEYLRMFVEEMLQIRGRKVLVSSSQKEMSVEIRLFCCDTKARTFITGT